MGYRPWKLICSWTTHALAWATSPHQGDPRWWTARLSMVRGRHRRGPALSVPAQVLRIKRRRRLYGVKKWSSETVYAITDLTAEEANAAEIAAWARGHWTVENTVHWVRDVVFGEDKSQVRTRNAPGVLAAVRDLIRSALSRGMACCPRRTRWMIAVSTSPSSGETSSSRSWSSLDGATCSMGTISPVVGSW
jgi:hypothetical protein